MTKLCMTDAKLCYSF